MMQKVLGALMAVAWALPAPAPAAMAPATGVEGPCGTRAHVLQMLAERYGETRRQTGWISGEGIVELYVSDSSGSWTLTLTVPLGKTCLVASGHGALTQPVRPAVAEQAA
ncbi:hypothetical protein [Alkalilacustris brevis]|uniref:hypothetical protein n=1 Tax=Alkalilacustris brevis TaxID=2026338 RepID=UPI000E0DB36A|nr:hypothetical protein [Alkalilacustris brevis]